MDAALRLAERTLARLRTGEYDESAIGEIVDATLDLNALRARAGLRLVCEACSEADDARVGMVALERGAHHFGALGDCAGCVSVGQPNAGWGSF